MPNFSDILAQDLTDHGIDLLRVGADANRRVQLFLSALQDDIAARVSHSNISAASKAKYEALLRDIRKLISQTYGTIDQTIFAQLSVLAQTEASIVAGTVNAAAGISIMEGILAPTALRELMTGLLIHGAPSSAWWLRQAQDLTFRFTTSMRMGIAQGETNAQLLARIRGIDGIFQQPRRAAEALVRTSVQTVANSARVQTFLDNSDVLQGMQQVSTLDDRTTPVCIAYDLGTWDLEGNPTGETTLPFVNEGGSPDGCPRHWGCRSSLIPILKPWEELGIRGMRSEPTVRASMDGGVAAKMDYESWLRTRSNEQQDEILGSGKAALWRSGKITARDLIDQSGRPLTLQQLQDKHA